MNKKLVKKAIDIANQTDLEEYPAGQVEAIIKMLEEESEKPSDESLEKVILRFDSKSISLRPGMEQGRIWLEIEDGEGADFPEALVFKILRTFYDKNF